MNIKDNIAEKDLPKDYIPSKEDEAFLKHVNKRVDEMKDWKKGLGVEDEWKEADKEYVPSTLETIKGKVRFEQDQDTGYRSRIVRVGDNTLDWRSNNSDPILLTKIQTAISIIIDRNPEAVLYPMLKKYENTTQLSYSLWKRNWEITNAKEVYKLFAFNLFLYGWAVGRVYPKLVRYDKSILVEYDQDNPEKNKYEEKELTFFNDISRQILNPYRTWIGETTQPYIHESLEECYFELDYSHDAFVSEFSDYPNSKYVGLKGNQVIYDENKKEDKKKREDIVTVGFYENRLKDLYCITIPAKKILLHVSPMPNDDGYLSLFQAPCILRSATNPFGMGLWKIIKQKKELYDKMLNMTMDQLVLSIMKMGFFIGPMQEGSGKVKIVPGKMEQGPIGGKVEWLEIPGPGQESWEGLKFLLSGIDNDSGITPTLEGELTGKTLGEVIHAKEAALKKMKNPLENLCDAMEQDAYITLSWMQQVYSIPEIKSFSSLEEIKAYEAETGVENQGVYGVPGEEGYSELKATYYPELPLNLETQGETFIESKNTRFFKIGKDIKIDNLKWKGIFKIIPKSLMIPSIELEKERKNEMTSILGPMLAQPPELFKKIAIQLCKVNDEKPEDWLPDSWLIDEQAHQLFVDNPALAQDQTMQNQAGLTPQKSTGIVPQPRGQNMMDKAKSSLGGMVK